ncbi:NAD(P)/FAD-dependent oxidoreductase [Halomicroarcula sp. F13]|uniref:NAD(P)/FAD-dependent oxidoreductase n=1 Tax=Haloarcula rubra TaxID=2487747 RepID=A0AAW4PUI6_9EURY|nr:NAD(P)/FAD-dependent oxidoreductase [Halomicroarcula rubra]
MQRVAVLGGAVGGLAAAEGFSKRGFEVDLFERQSYDDKRVNCGEAMTAVSKIPLRSMSANGFVNALPELRVDIYDGTTSSRQHTGSGRFPASDTYITDRNIVERRWSERLAEKGVSIHENHQITKAEFRTLADKYDLLVDATGQPSITSKVRGRTDEYAGRMIALNADVEGDFSDLYPNSQIVLEGYTGYAWAFSKSPERANIGIGWTESERPADYIAEFEAACERNGWPIPSRSQTNIAIIPEGPNLDPALTYLPEWPVVRVGDAAGLANRLTGKGISQAIQSSYLAAKLTAEGSLQEYPDRLYRTMKGEYLLARIMRHLVETRQMTVLGDAVQVVSGIDIEDIDRSPRAVLRRFLGHPRVAARIFSNPAVIKQTYAAVTDAWEYDTIQPV